MANSLMAMLGADISPLQSAFRKAQNEASQAGQKIGNNFRASMGALSGKIGSALTGLGEAKFGYELGKSVLESNKQWGEFAHLVEIGSERLGVSTDRFQQLEAAAKKGGSSIEAVYAAYRKLASASVEAEGGDAGMIAAFATLGITVEQLKRSSPDEIFTAISKNVRGAEMDTHRLAAVMKTMGKSADELVPSLKAGKFEAANPFGMESGEIAARKAYIQDLNVIAKAWATIKREYLGFSTSKQGFGIHRDKESWTGFSADFSGTAAVAWLANKARSMFGIEKDAPTKPIDLKTVTKADIESERQQTKVDQQEAKRHEQEMVRLKKQLHEEQQQTDLGAMTNAQKLEELARRRAKLLEDMKKTTDDEQQTRDAIAIEQIDQERQRVAGAMNKTLTAIKQDVNSLQQIGGYATAFDPHLKAQQDGNETLKRIETGINNLQKAGGFANSPVQY